MITIICPLCDSGIKHVHSPPTQCNHGKLTYTCPTCDLEKVVAEFREQNKTLSKKLAHRDVELVAAQFQIDCFYMGSPETQLVNMTKESDALRERLKEAQTILGINLDVIESQRNSHHLLIERLTRVREIAPHVETLWAALEPNGDTQLDERLAMRAAINELLREVGGE